MTSSRHRRPHRRPRPDPLLARYMPPHFVGRLPILGTAWRGRAVLLLWGLGYPFEMAWSLGLSSDPEQARDLEIALAPLDDAKLIDLLDATAEQRGDAGHLEWVSFG